MQSRKNGVMRQCRPSRKFTPSLKYSGALPLGGPLRPHASGRGAARRGERRERGAVRRLSEVQAGAFPNAGRCPGNGEGAGPFMPGVCSCWGHIIHSLCGGRYGIMWASCRALGTPAVDTRPASGPPCTAKPVRAGGGACTFEGLHVQFEAKVEVVEDAGAHGDGCQREEAAGSERRSHRFCGGGAQQQARAFGRGTAAERTR
jgi:hypothetical protein